MSSIFRTVDFQAADKAARELPFLVKDDPAKAFVLELMLVSCMVFFLTHISEHRRAIKVSSAFFRASVVRDLERRCKNSNLDDQAVKELLKIIDNQAKRVWRNREEAVIYKTSDSVIEALTDFLKKH